MDPPVVSRGCSTPRIARSMVTGYGEDLIRAAFGFDDGMVETLAHYQAAKAFDDKVTFVLDIGGQDMKAIFAKDGFIKNIEINESCSSGCGSFIETIAGSMGYQVSEFAEKACEAEAPCDLGTCCTVFMNSRVKQALREGAEIKDISAGLAYSVIKNALHKVLKVTNTDQLGDQIVVQGGTFRNPAVHKAMEYLLDKPVICPEMAELMGAYGAALAAKDQFQRVGDQPNRFVADKYLDPFMAGEIPLERDALLDALGRAVSDFNRLDLRTKSYPRVGIVGEIYVKYNEFSNNHVAQWLMEQGIEVVMPTFLEFFVGGIINLDISVRTNLKRPNLLWLVSMMAKGLIGKFLDKFDRIMQQYRFYHPHHDIHDIARKAKEIVSLNHQYGESWLIAGEIASFVRCGINNGLCLQPFGCIANHVIAKGVQKRMKELYLQLNLIFLDTDAGISQVNFFNRMHFFINHAKKVHYGRV